MAKFNLNLLILLVAVLVLIMQVRSCLAGSTAQTNALPAPTPGGQSDVIIAEASAADGLDLEAVGTLLNQAQNAEELERLLNAANGVNNLDLNADGITDFISVTEFGSGNERGFALSTELAPGEEQEIATILVKQQGQSQADVQIQGNQNLYGPGYYYHSRIGIGEVLLLGWLFRPHLPYYSPFAWGYYPGYYGGGYRTVSRSQYRSRTTEAKQKPASFQKSDKPQFRPQSTSPKANANAAASPQRNSQRSTLGGAQRSQRSFSAGSASGTGNAQKNSAQTNAQNSSSSQNAQTSSQSRNSRSTRNTLGTAQRSQRSFSTGSVRRSSSFRSGSRSGGGK